MTDNTDVVGYAGVTQGLMSPLFCLDCGEDVNREVEERTRKDMVNFTTASCTLCGETFYVRGEDKQLYE